MKSVSLKVYPRSLTRRAGLKQVRGQGKIPAVVYGREVQPQNLEILQTDLERVLHGGASENVLVDLTVEGDSRAARLALVQEVQHHPLSGKVLHVDFHEVSETEKVIVQVPVEKTGEAVGVKTGGGVLEHVLFKIKVRALPRDLPASIVVDVSTLEIGQTIHIGELVPPPGVEVLGDKGIPVFSVAAPLTEAEEAAAAAAAAAEGAAEPEMLREKKEEGAAEAGGDKKAEKGEKGEKAEKPEKAEKKKEK